MSFLPEEFFFFHLGEKQQLMISFLAVLARISRFHFGGFFGLFSSAIPSARCLQIWSCGLFGLQTDPPALTLFCASYLSSDDRLGLQPKLEFLSWKNDIIGLSRQHRGPSWFCIPALLHKCICDAFCSKGNYIIFALFFLNY